MVSRLPDLRCYRKGIFNFSDLENGYSFDKQSGTYSSKSDYEGVNILFHIPFDHSKADDEAANDFMKEKSKKYVSNCDNEYKEYFSNLLSTELTDEQVEKIINTETLIEEHNVSEKDGKYQYVVLNQYQTGSNSSLSSDVVEGKIQLFCDEPVEDGVITQWVY